MQLVLVALVVALVADRERLDRPRLALGEERRVGARVDAAGEEDADRHVADLAELHGRAKLGHEPLGDLLLGDPDERASGDPRRPTSARSRVAPSCPMRSHVPAGSLWMPSKSVRGAAS